MLRPALVGLVRGWLRESRRVGHGLAAPSPRRAAG